MTGFAYHRLHNALSVKDVSSVLGIKPQTVYNWENNKAIPNSETLIKVARLYGVIIDDLLEEYPNPIDECKKRLEVYESGTS